MASVELQGLTKSYGGAPAVAGFDLTINEGEMVALLGPSGCGKTTVLRMIAGLIEPDGGRVVLGGEDVTDQPVHRRGIGLVFQSYALFPHLSVFENVAFGLRRRDEREPEIKARVGAALALVRLESFAARFPQQLSGGQQQRVALARAVVTEPRVLLLDEPLSNLDAVLRDEMQVELKRLQRRLGVTTVFVTHDQEEALTLSDRIAVMNRGRLEQLGRPEEVYDRPASAFVAGFIGRSNFFAATVEGMGDGALRLAGPEGMVMVGAQSAQAPRSGSRVSVALRREKVRLASTGPDNTSNVFSGQIALRSFAGPISQYLVRLDGGHELLAELPASPAFEQGDRVVAWWHAEDLIVLPEGEALHG